MITGNTYTESIKMMEKQLDASLLSDPRENNKSPEKHSQAQVTENERHT